MSEALADLSRVSGNLTWLELAAVFERQCFIGPLILAGHTFSTEADTQSEPTLVNDESALAASAIERMHANAHLPMVLGMMAR